MTADITPPATRLPMTSDGEKGRGMEYAETLGRRLRISWRTEPPMERLAFTLTASCPYFMCFHDIMNFLAVRPVVPTPRLPAFRDGEAHAHHMP